MSLSRLFILMAAMLGATLVGAGAAHALPCPPAAQTAQITTPPAGWEALPDTDTLSGAEVTGTGTDIDLICTYGIAGRIKIEPPAGQRRCVVVGLGFDCRRPTRVDELGPPVGAQDIKEDDTVDLDSRKVIGPSRGSPPKIARADFRFDRMMNNDSRQLEVRPQNGAGLTGYAQRVPLLNECPPTSTATLAALWYPVFAPPSYTEISTVPLFVCLTGDTGVSYLLRLTNVHKVGDILHATATWWYF